MKPSLSNLTCVLSGSVLLFMMPMRAQVRQTADGPLIIFHAGSLSLPFEKIIEEFKKENPGTKEQPWDILSALSAKAVVVKPGDTIWLRGGEYKHGEHFPLNGVTCSLQGSATDTIPRPCCTM